MAQVKTDTKEALSSYSFNDPLTDFFGIPNSGVEEIEENGKAEPTKLKGEEEEQKPKGKKEEGIKEVKGAGEEEEDVDAEFFKEAAKKTPKPKAEKIEDKGEEEEEEEEEEKKEEEDEEEDFYTELAKESKQRGIFQNVDIPKDTKISEDKFFELQDAEVESRVNETFEAFFEELDDDGKAFLKFKKNGGNTREFLSQYLQPDLNLEAFDEDNATQVKLINEYYMRHVEGKDEEEVEDGLAWLKDNGKERAYAAKRYEKIKNAEIKRKQEVQEAVKVASEQREEGVKKFNQDLIDVLTSTEKIGDFQISKTEQKELGAYLVKPSIKVGKNKFVPPFQAKIAQIFRAETEKDKQHLILLAKLIRSDFDTSDLMQETQTKVVRQAKSVLTNVRKGLKPKTSGSYSSRSLSDYFG